jgi:dihydropteroate synthase
MIYYRPLVQTGLPRPPGTLPLAGGWCWFDAAVRMQRGMPGDIVPSGQIPPDILDRLTAPRLPVAGLTMDVPRIMGILNVTPDSFSDGGLFADPADALVQAQAMVSAGADIIDVGGESTRPGAAEVSTTDEIARVVPVIAAIRAGSAVPVSIDTRKSEVARAAISAGAGFVNDVAAFRHDPRLAGITADAHLPCCLMHAQGDPATMQANPTYADVTLDVYDFLSERIEAAIAAGIPRARIVIDPGIGFGKTLQHNLTLLRDLSLYHALGCPIMLGASRKRFIGTIGGVDDPRDRVPGSVAVALHGAAQGVQFLRVHDTMETRQALSLQLAVNGATDHGT